MFGNVQVDTGGDDGEAEEEEDYEDGPRRPQLSPIRLRMGWRSNGELEVRTGELQRMLDVLRSVSDAIGAEEGASHLSKWERTKAIDTTIRRFEQQQKKIDQLERELAAKEKTTSQAVASRAEILRRCEEERKRAEGLEKKLEEERSNHLRSIRQIELLRNPSQKPKDDDYDDGKPKPLHMRLDEVKAQAERKREKIREEAELRRTYAPAINETSALMAGRDRRPTPSAKAAEESVEAKAEEESPTSSPEASRERRESREAEAEAEAEARRARGPPVSADIKVEVERREKAEAAAAKFEADAKAAVARKAEVEHLLQKASTKERDQGEELRNALKIAKDAKSELGLCKKVAEASQLDAAQKMEEARKLTSSRHEWEAERAKFKAERDEAVAEATDTRQRAETAEKALREIAGGPEPSAAAIAADRQKRGIKDHPNAEAVAKQQQKAKIEKARMQMEAEKRARQKLEREVERYKEEQVRLAAQIEKLAAAGGGDGAAVAATLTAEIEAAKEAAAAAKAEAEAAAADSAKAGKAGKGRGPVAGGGDRITKESSHQVMQRHLRTEMEEATLIREISTMDEELQKAKKEAGTSTARLSDEVARRTKAETALDRFTRISALQKAATEALQFGLGSPGREGQDTEREGDEALRRLTAEIRASGLARGDSPRGGSDSARSGSETSHSTPRGASAKSRQSRDSMFSSNLFVRSDGFNRSDGFGSNRSPPSARR